MESPNQFVNSLAPKLSHQQRDFRHYAESGWVEFHTTTLVAEELHQLGYSLVLGRKVVNESGRMGLPDEFILQRGFERARQQGALTQWIVALEGGFTGTVATLDTGRPGPVMAFRVGMDALDLSGEQDVSHRPYCDGFASCNAGMMRTYGRDGYTAIGLGLAHVLKRFESGLHGVIKLIFQTAEKGTRGARAMIGAGVIDDADYFTAVHVDAGVPTDTVMCDSDNLITTTKFDVHFTGAAAHAGAKSGGGHDALLAAAQAILTLHIIAPCGEGTSRVNVDVMQVGSGRGVVPASALLKVETRGASDVINQYVFDRAQQAVQGTTTMYSVGIETHLMDAVTASSPSPQWVAWLQSQTARAAGVSQAIERVETPAGSGDVTLIMARVQQHQGQASYVMSGTQLAAGHHNEKFDFDEQVLTIAVETLARTVLNFPWTRDI